MDGRHTFPLIFPLIFPFTPPLPQTRARGEVSFNIDGSHMYSFDRNLYNWAICYPAETGGCTGALADLGFGVEGDG